MKITPEQIDAVLPQTQCGLCSYKGCLPYATALANQEAEINLCPPGGVSGLKKLGDLLARDPTPFISDMEQKTKPLMVAVIREAECIGCTKCIQACPVDAILGGAKVMHTVISDECSGCELCIAPCPVDCIDMVNLNNQTIDESLSEQRANQFRKRYDARTQRLQQSIATQKTPIQQPESQSEKMKYIQAAIARAQQKKQTSSI